MRGHKKILRTLAAVFFLGIVTTPSALAADPYIYYNEAHSFTLAIPAQYQNSILIKEESNGISLYHKASREAMGGMGGKIASLSFWNPASSFVNAYPAAGVLATHQNTAYVIMVPTDVQFPMEYASDYMAVYNALVLQTGAGSSYSLGFQPGVFSIVAGSYYDTSGHWAEADIEYWSASGVLSGYSDGSFQPNHTITRAEMATILTRLMGYTETAEGSFSDVKPADWYADAVSKAVAAGVMTGYSNDRFGPLDNLTRQDAVVILCRAMGMNALENASTAFTDDASIAAYARGYVAAMSAGGWIGGYGDGSFQPEGSITRAEIVTILSNCMKS